MKQLKTKLVCYEVHTCLGKRVGNGVLRIPIADNPADYETRALRKLGLKQFVCDGCYDHRYHVHYEET